MNNNTFVLVLAILDHHMCDRTGRIYPIAGVIDSPDFKHDKDITTGLWGVLWGKISAGSSWVSAEEDSIWIVIKTEVGGLIKIDEKNGIVKFQKGEVLFKGNQETTPRFIINHRNDIRELLQPDASRIKYSDLAGSVTESFGVDNHVVNKGFAGRCTTRGLNSHAVTMGDKSSSVAREDSSHAINLGEDGNAVATGNMANAVAVNFGSRARSTGLMSKAVAVNDHSTVVSTGSESMAVGLGIDSRGSAGEEGILILAYLDRKGRKRIATGYVGKDIEKHIVYRCEDGRFKKVI